MIDLDVAEDLHQSTTPGPWGWPMANALAGNYADGFDGQWTLIAAIHDAGPVSDADAEFIVEAHRLWPVMIAELRAAREMVAAVVEAGEP